MRARTSALMFLTCFFTEDITALICTLSYLLICSHCVWDREQQYCRFCLSVPYFFYFWSITISQPRMFCSPCKVLGGGFCKRVNSALRQRWSEINLSGCHILGSAMKNKTQCNEFLHMPWTSHYGWQSALVYLMIPRHKWPMELTGDFILKLTGRFDVPASVQLIMNTPTLDVIPECSNSGTWHFLSWFCCLYSDL